jgi:hypothetical protein
MNPAPPVMRNRIVSLPDPAAIGEWVPRIAVHRFPSAYDPRFDLSVTALPTAKKVAVSL